MSIRKEIFLMLFIVIALYAGIDYATHRLVVYPSYLELEQHEAVKDMQRCVSALQREIAHLDQFAHDWSAWDDTYGYVVDHNQEYVDSNLPLSTFVENKLNLVYIIDNTGKVVWGESYDLASEEPIVIPEIPAAQFPLDHLLLGHKEPDQSSAGIFMTSLGPMLVSSRPVVTSNGQGPIRGTLIMARLFNDEYVQTLADQTKTALKIWSKNSDQLPAEYRRIMAEIDPGDTKLAEVDDQILMVFNVFADLRGDSSLLLRVEVDREISGRGRVAVRFAMMSLVGGGILVVALFLSLLRIRVIKPLENLTRHATAVGRSDDLSARVSIGGNNELSALAREFNAMIEKLATARGKLIDQSYNSGMAEITSGVTHNIRNTVNPIIADIVLLREKTRYLPLENMGKSVGELTAGPVSEERGIKLKEFLVQSLKLTKTIFAELEVKLSNMEERSQLIERLLSDLEKFAYSGGFLREKLHLSDLVQDAMYLFQDRFKDKIEVEIAPSIQEVGQIETHKSALMQIFINLLYNAGESILKAGSSPGLIKISAVQEEIEGRKMVHVKVCDNGLGIAPEVLENIFERGYTTKEKKISGIGLHWCANTIFALRGKLYPESKGIGTGACMHILIPEDMAGM